MRRIVGWVVAPVYVVVVSVGGDAVEPEGGPRQGHEARDQPAPRRHAGRVVVGLAFALLALCAGMGWLYLLRELGALDAGPRLSRALPLEQLARGDDQPLLRVAVAWLPAGAAAGLALTWALGWGPVRRGLAVGLLGAVLLFATGAASDAIAVNERVATTLGSQFSHEGIWIEVACIVIGSLLIGRASWAGSRDAAAAASPP